MSGAACCPAAAPRRPAASRQTVEAWGRSFKTKKYTAVKHQVSMPGRAAVHCAARLGAHYSLHPTWPPHRCSSQHAVHACAVQAHCSTGCCRTVHVSVHDTHAPGRPPQLCPGCGADLCGTDIRSAVQVQHTLHPRTWSPTAALSRMRYRSEAVSIFLPLMPRMMSPRTSLRGTTMWAGGCV